MDIDEPLIRLDVVQAVGAALTAFVLRKEWEGRQMPDEIIQTLNTLDSKSSSEPVIIASEYTGRL